MNQKKRLRRFPAFLTRSVLKDVVVGALLGVFAFGMIYGFSALEVTNDQWILSGYAEWDIQQHYAGWVNYRQSDWAFPLGQANQIGFPSPRGVNISFMDSMPLLCVCWKLFDRFLPEVFQFEGLYGLTLFVLQGVAAMLLLRRFRLRFPYRALAALFFVFSPVLIERCFRHTALASHYIILFALLMYFRHRDTHRLPWLSLILSVLSVGITPYFLPMVSLIWLLIFLENTLTTQNPFPGLLFFIANIGASLACAYTLGSVGNGYGSSREGFGYYSMNLNAVVNPYSNTDLCWSKIFPIRPQLYGQYDGFNYLGAGVMLLLFTAIGLGLGWAVFKKWKIGSWIRRNFFLLLAMAFLTCFALSHVICYDDKELFSIPLSGKLLELCGTFRASSRLFYPVYYLLLLWGVVGLSRGADALITRGKKLKTRVSCGFLALFLCVQFYDLSGILLYKHQEMAEKTSKGLCIPESLLHFGAFDEFFAAEPTSSRMTAIVAAKNHLPSNCLDTNTYSPDFNVSYEHTNEILDELSRGIARKDVVYTTRDARVYSDWVSQFGDRCAFYLWNMNDSRYQIWDQAYLLFFMTVK